MEEDGRGDRALRPTRRAEERKTRRGRRQPRGETDRRKVGEWGMPADGRDGTQPSRNP